MAKNNDITDKSLGLFNGLIEALRTALQGTAKEVQIYIQQQRDLGISDEQIFKQLKSDLDNQEGFFSALSGKIEGQTDTGLNMLAQLMSNMGIIGKKKNKYIWKLDPNVQKHCQDCLDNAALGAHDIGFWAERGLPGGGTTKCKRYCHCTLDVVKDEKQK